MLIINIKENESIDKALKRFKKKFEKTGVLKRIACTNSFRKAFCHRRTSGSEGRLRQKQYVNEKLIILRSDTVINIL